MFCSLQEEAQLVEKPDMLSLRTSQDRTGVSNFVVF